MTPSTDAPEILPHGELVQLASNLWLVEGSVRMPLGKLKRNMVVYRLGDGDLVLHSVVAMNQTGLQALEALGRPAYMVVPHGGHRLDACFYKLRYPDIKVVAPARARMKVEEVIKVDGTEEQLLRPLGIDVYRVDGMKPDMAENVLLVKIDGGRALIMNDVVGWRGAGRGLMKLFGTPGDTFGVARVVKWKEISNRDAVRRTLTKLAEIPNVKVVTVSHGAPLRERIADGLRTAAAQL